MSETSCYRPATIAVHAGHVPDAATRARAVPIYQTTSYVFDSADHAARAFALKEPANIYTRIGNPTTSVLEERLAQLEGGAAAVALSSGQAAIALAILNLARAGQNIVSSSAIYGGTYNLFHHTLARFGIETRFVDSSDASSIEASIDRNTRLFFTESIGNPKNNVDDFTAIADLCQAHGLPFVVDNTVSPLIFRPFDHGADVVVYSLTKFVGGHGTAIGGAIVDAGRFDWKNGRFPEFTEPDPSYHGLVFCTLPAPFAVKARAQLLRDLGPCLSPFNASQFIEGLETLPLRIEAHCSNARRVAEWLHAHSLVSWVNYPLLPDHPDHDRAKRYLPHGAGAIVGCKIRGGLDAALRVIDSVKLFSHLANIGDAKSLIIHPASTTHQQLSEEERNATGVTGDLLRLSIGIEDVEDIIADLDQAITASQAERRTRSMLLVG